ncbi:MAG: putative sugar nucleotidyl transferase [Candidatus Zixiibacteriota bacterium]
MPLTICIYEDSKYRNFTPLTHFRPVYTLRAGVVPLFERAKRHFGDAALCLSCRGQLATVLASCYKAYAVNIIKKNATDILLLNGRIRDYGDLPKLIREAKISTHFTSGGETVALLWKNDSIRNLPEVATPSDYHRYFKEHGDEIPEFHTTATLYEYLWHIMADIEREITTDFEKVKSSLGAPMNVRIHDGVYWVNQDNVILGNDVEIMPGSVIDASRGPVFIDNNSRVESHAAIYGPTYIGPNCVIVAGKISGCSIGHTCRVGGEIEASVFQSYVNKYHAGFIGHSYVGSWVNFGAMTTNSDLKNNYSNIRVTVNGESVDTGSNKVGSFIGDHTKFGIGMLLTTGINVGVCCNLFGGSLISDKEIPSFKWGATGSYTEYDYRKALETARITAARRNYTLSDAEEGLMIALAEDKCNGAGTLDI